MPLGNTVRLSSLVALVASLAGCPGPGGFSRGEPPARTSPVLEPTGEAPVLGAGMIADLRRDGSFAVMGGSGIEVRTFDGTRTETLFNLPDRDEVGALLVSNGDHVVLATWDVLHHYDGATLVDETPRILEGLILAHETDLVTFVGLDAEADGTITTALTVGGQAGDAPYGQLCTLAATGPATCIGIDDVDPDGTATATAIVVSGARTYAVIDERLFVRADGAWSAVTPDRVIDVRALADGTVAYVRDGGLGETAMHVLAEDGTEIRRLDGVWWLLGHGADLWEVGLDRETDGSCSLSWSSCTEGLVWAQIVVSHLGETRTEIAHLDSFPGDELYEHREIVLPDGTLRLEIGADVYVLSH